MAQFNLLPDVKIQYLKAMRMKRLAYAISILVSGVSLVIFALLFVYVDVYQNQHLTNLTTAINTSKTTLEHNSKLSGILTLQNQLTTLPLLEKQVPANSLLFGYLTQLTPTQATISATNIDYNHNTISLTGNADSLGTVNQFVDTLNFATYTASGNTQKQPAFSSVVLSSFGYGNSTSGKPASFTITANFDPTIFSNTVKVNLNVPQQVTTRSVIDQPNNNLFVQGSTAPASGTGGH